MEKGISSELTRARRNESAALLMVKDIYCAVPTCRTGRSSMKGWVSHDLNEIYRNTVQT